MRIALAQLNIHVGNFEANVSKILAALHTAEALQADLMVCSELAVCGYPARDFLEFQDFIERCEAAIHKIAANTQNTAVLVGAPARNLQAEGKDLYNAAYLLANGKVQKVIYKTLLPTYDVFDEYRYFEPNKKFELIEWRGKKLAITICEDIWNIGNDNPLYTVCPMDELVKLQPDVMLNLSASPFNYQQQEERLRIVRENCLRYQLPMVYVNQVGAQTELIFDGDSMVLNAQGDVFTPHLRFRKLFLESIRGL